MLSRKNIRRNERNTVKVKRLSFGICKAPASDFQDQYCASASWSLQSGGLEYSSIEPACFNFLLSINPKLQLAVAVEALSI